MSLYFILFLVLLIVVVRQSGRISRLEKRVDGFSSGTVKPTQSAPSGTVGSAVSSMSSGVTPSMTNTPLTEPAQMKTSTPVVSEESSGKILGRIGIAAVLLGLVFFLKYAFDNNWIGETGRVMLGVIAGVFLLALGQFLRKKYLQYSDILMGGGIAALYLSVFSAYSFYHLINSFTAFIFMACVTALAFAISIVNATMTLSIIAVLGGVLTPIFVSDGSNAMLSFFTYLTILNAGVLGISFFKKWQPLVYIALFGTVVNFAGWYGKFYSKEVLIPVTLFVLVTFGIFLLAALGRVVVAKIKADGGDYLLLGANALLTAALLYDMYRVDYHAILGFGAVVFAIIYMIVAYVVNKANGSDIALNIFIPGIAVTFLSVAVPLQLSGVWIGVAWFVEAFFLYVIASKINDRGFQVMGVIVYALGVCNLGWYESFYNSDLRFVPIFNTGFWVFVLAVAVAYAIGHMYRKYGSISVEIQKRGMIAFFIVANVLTLAAGTIQISRYFNSTIASANKEFYATQQESRRYDTVYNYSEQASLDARTHDAAMRSLHNQSNTLVSIFWALYAAVATALGFARRAAGPRRLGLILFVITALKVLFDVWSLGDLYRIISFVLFGIIALVASFAYAKFKDRLKALVMLAIMLSIPYGFVRAEFSIADWKYQRAIDIPSLTAGQTGGQSSFVKLELPATVSQVKDDARDVRIIDSVRGETSYRIVDDVLGQSENRLSPRISDMSILGGSTQFILDLGTNAAAYDSVTLDTSTPTFTRQMSVFAADSHVALSSNSWRLVTNKGYIYSFTDSESGFHSQKTSVSFPRTTARFLKIVIAADPSGTTHAQNPVNAVKVDGASIVALGNAVPTIFSRELPALITNNAQKKTTEVVVDQGSAGYRVSSMIFSTQDTNFNRRVLIDASKDGVVWNSVGADSISSIRTTLLSNQSLEVQFPLQTARFLRATIVNHDNRPLTLVPKVTLSGSLIYALFEAVPGAQYSLYYGNPTAKAPQYDTAYLSQYVGRSDLVKANLGAEIVNPEYKAPAPVLPPFSERYPWLLNTLLVIVVLILGGGIGWYLVQSQSRK